MNDDEEKKGFGAEAVEGETANSNDVTNVTDSVASSTKSDSQLGTNDQQSNLSNPTNPSNGKQDTGLGNDSAWGDEEEEISVEQAFLQGDLDNLSKKEQKKVDKWNKNMADENKREDTLNDIKWKIGDNVTVTTDYGGNADVNGDHEITGWDDYITNKSEKALANTIYNYGDLNEEEQRHALQEAFEKHNKAGKDDTMNFWDRLGAKISAPFERTADRFNDWRVGKTGFEDLDGNPLTTNYGVTVVGKGKNGELTNFQKRQIARREKALADSIPGFKDMNPEQQAQAMAEAYKKANKNGKDGLQMGELAGLQISNKINDKLYGGVGLQTDPYTTSWGGSADRNNDGEVTDYERWLNSNNERALANTIVGFDDMSTDEKRKAMEKAFDIYDMDDDGHINLIEHGIAKASKVDKYDELIQNTDGGFVGGAKKTAGIIGQAIHNIFHPFEFMQDVVNAGARSEQKKLANMTPEERAEYIEERKKKNAEIAEQNKLQAEQSNSTSISSAISNPPVKPINSMGWLDKIREQRYSMMGMGTEEMKVPVQGNIRRSRGGMGLGWDRRAMQEKRKKGYLPGKQAHVTGAVISDEQWKDYIIGAALNDDILIKMQKLIMLQQLAPNKVIQTPNGNVYLH